MAFGEIPTSSEESNDRLRLDSVPEKIVARYKGEVGYILKHSITYGLNHNLTLNELKRLMKYITNKRAFHIFLEEKGLSKRDILIDALYLFRNQIYVYGDINQKLVSCHK